MGRVNDAGAIHELRVPPQLQGERLDRVLLELLESRGGAPSRTRLQGWIREGRVELEGLPVLRPGQILEAGQSLRVRLPAAAPEIEPERVERELRLVFQDEHLAVADKPAGLLSHRSPGGSEPSLADLAAAALGELPSSDGPERGGIVHRLDRDTSGLMVLARTQEALVALQEQFREHRVEKRYLAFVHGVPRFDSEWIESPLGRDPRRSDRVTVVPEGEGRPARTFYEVLERYHGFALLACQPKTGRMHQIRVHLAAAGLPIVGDRVYPLRRPPDLVLPAAAPDPGRHALHAARLAFEHPITATPLAFESDLPVELESLRRWLARS